MWTLRSSTNTVGGNASRYDGGGSKAAVKLAKVLIVDDKGDVARKLGPGFEIGFHGFEVRKVLAFVVTRPAREQGTALDARFEGRRFP